MFGIVCLWPLGHDLTSAIHKGTTVGSMYVYISMHLHQRSLFYNIGLGLIACMIVKIELCSGISETNATFRHASTGLDHALVARDLTQILAEGSGCRWGEDSGIPDLGQVTGHQCVIEAYRNVTFISHILVQSNFY